MLIVFHKRQKRKITNELIREMYQTDIFEQHQPYNSISNNISYEFELDKKPNFIVYNEEIVTAIVTEINRLHQQYVILCKTTTSPLYRKFSIPKRNGNGRRHLIEPIPLLKEQQQTLLVIIQRAVLFPNSVMAYVPRKSAVEVAKIHKESKYFITLDLKDFFNSITREVLIKQLKNIYFFHTLEEKLQGTLEKIADLAIYEGKLPQGSPLSPILSNLVMLQFDHTIKKLMRNKEIPNYIYTRYADDIVFSAKNIGKVKLLIDTVENCLENIYNGSIKLNKEKTKILNNNKKCYITGVKINQENKTTYGHEKKRRLKLELYNLFKAERTIAGIALKDYQRIMGKFNYMRQIEPNYAQALEKKFLVNFDSEHSSFKEHFHYLHTRT